MNDLYEDLKDAEAESNKGNYPESSRIAQSILAKPEKDTELHIAALLVLSHSLLNMSKYDKALECANTALNLAAQHDMPLNSLKALHIIGNIQLALDHYNLALESYNKAVMIADSLGDKGRLAKALGNIGIVYFKLGELNAALENFSNALAIHHELGETLLEADAVGNIGVVYQNLGNPDKALEYAGLALALYEQVKYTSGIGNTLGNIGNIYGKLANYDRALDYYRRSLAIFEQIGKKSSIARFTGNVGIIYSSLGDHDQALEYFNRALDIYQEIAERSGTAVCIGNIGSLYADPKFRGYNAAMAEDYMLQAISINEEIGRIAPNIEIFATLARLYEQTERWQQANEYNKKAHALEKEIQNEEVRRKTRQMEQKREIAEREKEIEIAKVAAAAELTATTSLLHKVLPDVIASRIIAGEEEIADYYPSVSILFADIVGFTPMSADMPAYVIVRLLNHIFSHFDHIMKTHGCEKIKTIGDGYMAISGAPVPCDDHAERMVRAAMDMLHALQLPEEVRDFVPDGVVLNIRIGIHTGSVVAGVVGEDRFVYDVYSDAVNTAARMESHGEPGRVHVSSDFMRHLLNRFAQARDRDHGFTFEKRGEIEVKGKGMMKTFFLERK